MSQVSVHESRVKKTMLNARVNIIFYFIFLAITFYSRKIFLDCLGDDFIGLTGTLNNLLGFLSLAELGIGGAVGYLLYKPLYNHDQEKITEIISVMGYLYRWIGFIILGGGLVLACFLPLIFPDRDTHLTLGIIYFAYFAFLGSSLIGYFINYRQNLLSADQRNYVVTAYFQTGNIIKAFVQMALAWYTRNLFLWVAIEFIFGILYSIILNWKIRRVYPWLRANVALGHKLFKKYPEVMQKTRQIFFHRIGGFFQFQITPLLIYAFATLSLVAYYQNYTIIISRVSSFFSNFFSGIAASIGNLIAEGDMTKSMNIFHEILSLNFFITGLVCVPIYLLADQFIIIWLGVEYVLPKLTLILILIPAFISGVRGAVDNFINGFGLFWDVWAPIVESIILVITAVIGGYFWGLNGVLLGSIASLGVIVCGWRPFLLFHWGFKHSVFQYWIAYVKNGLCIFVALIATLFLIRYIPLAECRNFLDWVVCAIPVFLIYALISYLLFLCFSTGMKAFNQRVLQWTGTIISKIRAK